MAPLFRQWVCSWLLDGSELEGSLVAPLFRHRFVVGCWMAVNEKGVWWPLCSDSGFVVGCWMAVN